jgi:hypothetical protein
MPKKQNSIQSMALQIAKVANEVSNVLGTQVTIDQVFQISQILDGEKSTSSTSTMVKTSVKKVKTSNPKGPRLDWKKFNFDKYTDGLPHTVSAMEIRSLLGVSNRISNLFILKRFTGRLALWSLRNGGLSVRSHLAKDHNSITVQLYVK